MAGLRCWLRVGKWCLILGSCGGSWAGAVAGTGAVLGKVAGAGAGAGKGLCSSPELAGGAGRCDFCCNEVYLSYAKSPLDSVSGRRCCAVCRLSAALVPSRSHVLFSSCCLFLRLLEFSKPFSSMISYKRLVFPCCCHPPDLPSQTRPSWRSSSRPTAQPRRSRDRRQRRGWAASPCPCSPCGGFCCQTGHRQQPPRSDHHLVPGLGQMGSVSLPPACAGAWCCGC